MKVLLIVAVAVCSVVLPTTTPAARTDDAATGCLQCHQGIEPTRQPGAEMLEEILAMGRANGDPAGCIVCHGGDVKALDKETAHQGRSCFSPLGANPRRQWARRCLNWQSRSGTGDEEDETLQEMQVLKRRLSSVRN